MMAKLNTSEKQDCEGVTNSTVVLSLAAIGLTGLFVFGFDSGSRQAINWLLPVGSLAALASAAISAGAKEEKAKGWLAAGTLSLVCAAALSFNVITPLPAVIASFAFATGFAFRYAKPGFNSVIAGGKNNQFPDIELAASFFGGDVFAVDQKTQVLSSSNAMVGVGTILSERILIADRPAFMMACDKGNKSNQDLTLRYQPSNGALFVDVAMNIQNHNGQVFVAIRPVDALVKMTGTDSDTRELAHELRTPLAAIVGFAEALAHQDQCTAAMRATYPALIATAGRNLIDLTATILESKVEKIDLKHSKLGDVVQECLALLQLSAGKKSVALYNRLPAAMAEKPIDGGVLRQIIINLVSNAVKFSRDGASVEVTASMSANGWSLCVADNGDGLTPEVVARLGQKNFRGDNAIGVAGFGLGLSIVHRLVDDIGARINFESRPGNGTKVVIAFPASKLIELSEFLPQAAHAAANQSNFHNAAGAKHAAA